MQIDKDTLKLLRDFPLWLHKNYKKATSGWRHKGDFYNNHKSIPTEEVMRLYIKEMEVNFIGFNVPVSGNEANHEIKQSGEVAVCDHKQYPYTTEIRKDGYMHDRICDNCRSRW